MPPSPRPPVSGRLHHTRRFDIPGFGARSLTLYLPPGYDQSTQRYPVAYFFDAQNLFGDAGSYSGGWHLHDALDKRATAGKPVPVVVAIPHGGVARADELSPWKAGRAGGGRGNAFLDWVTGPLVRMVDEDVRVLPGPAGRLLAGSSLGGLMALYGFFRHPDVFGGALAMSPSLWVGNGALQRYVAQQGLPWTRRVYLDSGGREAGGHALRQAEHFAGQLTAKGFVADHDLMWRPDKSGSHNERAWSRRLPKALKFLYG
jgi:predicted alpha/beta superfamily hydrolase